MSGSPAARLLAAADLLDKRASEATEGPWAVEQITGHDYLPVIDNGVTKELRAVQIDAWAVTSPAPDDEGQRTAVVMVEMPFPAALPSGGCWDEDDARYIATMHPEVGKLLARMMRDGWHTITNNVSITNIRLGLQPVLVSADLLDIADLILAGAE